MANNFKNLTMTGNHAADTDLVVGDFGGVNNAVASGSEVTVIGMSIANITSGVISVSVKLFHNTTETYIVRDAPIPSGGSLIVAGGDQKLVLWYHNSYGNLLKVQSNTVNSMNILLSYLEST